MLRNLLNRFGNRKLHERRVFSQNGEDGVIEELFARLGTSNCFFVEVAAGDGRECNTLYLASRGWRGLMIEGNSSLYARLQSSMKFPGVVTLQKWVTRENVLGILCEANVQQEFDLLSIDIDGNDYWIWQEVGLSYKPRVVVIEYNAYYAPPRRWVMKYKPQHVWDGTTHYGASLSSLADLGNKMGYALIGTESMGVNAFFIRRELVRISGLKQLSAGEAFHPARYTDPANPGKYGHPFRDGPHVAI